MICGLVLKCIGSRRANVSPGSKSSSLASLVTNPKLADYRWQRTQGNLQAPPVSTSRCCGTSCKRHLLCSSPSRGCAGIGFVRGWGFWPGGLGGVRRGSLEDIGFWVLPRRGLTGFASIFSTSGFDFRVSFGCWSVFRDIMDGWFKTASLYSLGLRFFVVARLPVFDGSFLISYLKVWQEKNIAFRREHVNSEVFDGHSACVVDKKIQPKVPAINVNGSSAGETPEQGRLKSMFG